MKLERVFAIRFDSLYPQYVRKVESKGRTSEELDEVLRWLTGYDQEQLEGQIERGVSLEAFFAEAPETDRRSSLVRGVVCGVRVEEVEHPLMRKIRAMDKVVDELARGKTIEKILRR